MTVTRTLADGKEYTFSVIGIGHFKRHHVAVGAAKDAWEIIAANLLMIEASLKKAHPDLTFEQIEMDLITNVNSSDAMLAVQEACGIKAGEASPVAS